MMRPSITLLLSILLCSSYYQPSFSTTLTSDGFSLLSFKYSILHDPLHIFDSWSSHNDTPCSWQGVTCSDPNTPSDPVRVIGLSLPGSQLLGSLSSINLTLLDQLQWLNVSSNSINGSIPFSLFSLLSLRVLDLSENFISGELPELAGELQSLEVIDLSENSLEGNIPRNLSRLQNLTMVSLRGNYFSGNLQPGSFNRVKYLDLSSNLINGSLPVEFGGRSVKYLNISYNRITGEIPPELGQKFPENATLDFSSNYFSGEIPNSRVFYKQKRSSFAGNWDLCGPPSGHPCPAALPYAVDEPIPPPAIAVIPEVSGNEDATSAPTTEKNNGLRPHIIVAIIVGDVFGIFIFAIVFIYACRRKATISTTNNSTSVVIGVETASSKAVYKGANSSTAPVVTTSLSRSSSSSSSESKGIAKWSCLKRKSDAEEEDEESDEEKPPLQEEQKGQLVTVDGERQLEVETLLKASAYILGGSGNSILYKAVLEDGTILAVRRVGECSSAERFKDFETQVRAIAKMVHSNLVRVRGFYWGSDEKLIIYEYVPNGNLASARYRKAGSSPCHLPWEARIRIAKGVARGLSYIHEKKHVHGNLKPSNILLDLDMEPKIADFGLERLSMGRSGYIPSGSTRHFGSKRSTASRESFQDYLLGPSPSPSTSSMGCLSPYHSPEMLRSLKPSSKWDVYSFGVVLLELLTGKVVVSDDQLGPPVLAGLAVGLEDKARVLRMADVAIRAELEGREEDLLACLKLGYNCISHVPQKRPSMKEAFQVLEKIPTYSTTSSSHYYGP